jgi:hypothetical protein
MAGKRSENDARPGLLELDSEAPRIGSVSLEVEPQFIQFGPDGRLDSSDAVGAVVSSSNDDDELVDSRSLGLSNPLEEQLECFFDVEPVEIDFAQTAIGVVFLKDLAGSQLIVLAHVGLVSLTLIRELLGSTPVSPPIRPLRLLKTHLHLVCFQRSLPSKLLS